MRQKTTECSGEKGGARLRGEGGLSGEGALEEAKKLS